MGTVQSVVIDKETGTDNRRVFFTITLSDNDANTEQIKVGPVVMSGGDDAATIGLERANRLLDSKSEAEDSEYENVEKQGDLLTFTLNPKWSTSSRIARKLIRWMMRERDPRIVVFLEPLIMHLQQNYTAAELRNFLNLTPTQMQKLNRRVSAILTDTGTVKTQLLAFDAELEDIE